MNKKILIVEDEQDLLKLYNNLLTDEGYLVDTVADGKKGYELIKKGGYDLILLDELTPRLKGTEILEKLKKNPLARKRNKKIVITTNLDIETITSKTKGYKIDGYMIKSNYTPEEFIKEVKKYL